LDQLLEGLHKKEDKKIVVLVDEYDSLHLDALEDKILFEQINQDVKDFFCCFEKSLRIY